jgi:hypothetical protein
MTDIRARIPGAVMPSSLVTNIKGFLLAIKDLEIRGAGEILVKI